MMKSKIAKGVLRNCKSTSQDKQVDMKDISKHIENIVSGRNTKDLVKIDALFFEIIIIILFKSFHFNTVFWLFLKV